jgi:hypothetical protein
MTNSGAIQKSGEHLGPELLNRVATVLGSTAPGDKGLSPSIVRQLFLDSGIFLEPKLAAGQPPGNDLKASLLLLLLQIRTAMTRQQRPTPQSGEQQSQTQADSAINKLLNLLLRQAEGGLARIQLNQLNSLPPEDGSKVVWQFELPLRHADEFDSFKIRIEREDGNNEQAQHCWRITLNFDLDPLGPVQAQISLQGEEVSTLFTTERKESAATIDQHLPILSQAFSQAGLRVGHLTAQKTGSAAMEEPQLSPHPLLDEQA